MPKKKNGKKKQGRSRRHSPSPAYSGPTMGLDLSLTGTGLVVWHEGRRKVLRHGRLKTEPHPPNGKQHPSGLRPSGVYRGHEDERIEWVRRKVAGSLRKYEPGLVAIEGHSFASKGRGTSPLHELHGVIKNLLLRQQVPYILVAPSTLKKLAAGHGRADKLEMIAAAKEFWPECFNDDEADAFHLARHAALTYHDVIEPAD